MFVGVGSLMLGDVDFENVIIPFCSNTFVLNQNIKNYTYSYLDSSSQTLKVAGSSVKPQTLDWTLDLSFPLIDFDLYSKLESLLGVSVRDFNPVRTFYTTGGTTLDLEDDVEILAYNITQEKPQLVENNNTFPFAKPDDTIFVVVLDESTEPRELRVFDASQTLSFLGIMHFNNTIYYLNIPAMQPSNRIRFSDKGVPSITYNVIKLKNKSPFKVFKRAAFSPFGGDFGGLG